MKKLFTFLVLLFGVLSSLMAQKANLYLVGQLSNWQFEEAYQFSSADDDYFVLSFPEGQELELTGQFKVASSGWSPHNYGASPGVSVSVEVDKEYALYSNSTTNLNVADIIQVSKIEFTVSTQTLKITGATQEKVFDTTTDYGFYIAADYKDYPFTFKGNGVYEYDYTGSAPSAKIGDYQYKTVEFGSNGSTLILNEPYQLANINIPIDFPQAATGQTLTIVLTVLSDWSATILVKEKSSGDVDPVVPPVNPDPVYPEIWLSGQVTGYQRLDEWKFTSNDGDNYVIDFATPTELTSLFNLVGKEDGPIVENPGGEPIYNFSVEARTNIEANKTYTLVPHGRDAIGVEGIIEATRIEFQLSTGSFKVIGTSKAKVFDVTKDYNLCINFDPASPMTFKGNGVYTGTYVVSADATGYKAAFNFGDVNNRVVAMGSTDPLLYNVAIPLSTTYNSLVTQHVCNGGDKFECTLTFKSDWTASVVVSYIPNLEGRTYTVCGNGSSDPSGVWCGGIEWGNDNSPVNIMTDADKDGIYQVTYKNVPAGSYAFKVVGSVESWMGGDYLDFDNSSMGVKEEDKLYDGDGNIMFTLNQAADVTIQYNIYTGKIIVTTPSGSFGKPKLEYFHIASGNHDQCKVEDAFTEANNYTLTFQKGVMVNENGNAEVGCFILGNCDYTVYRKYFSTTVTESGTYNVTVTFNGDYENPDFTVMAVKVESADAIPVYIMGGFNNWKPNEDYKLTSTDGDYYVATYPAGSELKIEGGFKLGSADNWESIDLGAAYPDMQIEPGYEFTLSRGGENIIPAGVLLVSKIELVLSEGLLKITGTAVQDIFDVTQDVGIALVEFTGSNPDVTQTFIPLTFKGNGVYQGDYIYAGATNVRFKVGGKESLAMIDFGNGSESYLSLDVPFTLKRGAKPDVQISPADIEAQNVEEGDTFAVTVTITADWQATLLLQKTASAPKPVISNLNVPAFAQIEIGNTATVTATYTLENATKATASVEAPFYILNQSVKNGVGSIELVFMPETSGTYNGTLTITSGKTTLSKTITAVAVDPKPEVVPVIKNLQVPAFASTYVDESSVVTATYTLENATEAKASIAGADAESFIIVEQTVGSVKIMFIPQAAGTHQATLTITSGQVTQSASLIATAVASVPDPQVVLSNLVVPTFATVEQGKNAKVIATFNVENTTDVVAQLTGADAEVFVLGKVNVSNEQGSVQIVFIPETAGTYNATLTLRAGNATSSVNFSATAIAPKPVVSITNINVPAFPEVYEGGYAMVDITYTLINASNALVTVSNDDIFILQNQKVQNGKGSAELLFAPDKAGLYNAVLTIEADGVSESVNVVAVAKVENAVEPDMQVSISDVQVPAFESITEKQTTKVVASYVLKGTENAVVTLSGNDAQNGFFTILSQSVSEGIGRVEIEFAPNAQGVFNATLTISAGGETASVGFSATALPAPVITLQNEPTFTNTYVGEKQTELVSYTLQHATQAAATLAGDVDVFTLSYQELSNGNGLIRIDFEPEAVGTYTATLLITSGVTTKRVTISATAVAAPAPEPDPVININPVPDFGTVYVNETAQVVATYTLQNATEATASLSENKVFSIVRTLKGAVIIKFTPTAAGTYYDTLIITAGKVSKSVNVVATAIAAPAPEPDPVININPVPDFGTVYVNETAQVVATYTLQNATAATAIISGDKAFSIVRTLKGAVLIKFAPTAAGTYNGTLTITSGKVSESITFSAIAVEEGAEEPGPGPEDPVEPEKPDPLPEYPVRGYMYVVNTPDAELEKMVKYKPVSIDKVDYFLAPEKTGQKIYGYDIYKFEVRDEEMIDLWEYPNAQYTSWHIDVNVDLSATPYLANGVWYASIEEMMTWYVRYIPQWDDEASEKMIVESPNVYVATFDAFAESDHNDKYYYCLGNVEDPILEVGVSESGNIQNYLQIPQGFKAMIYLDDTNWETEWKTYYKLVPPGKDWDRDCIDLGLTSGLCWATKNLGATEPQQEGTHFAWGEVEPKEDYSYNTYKWANLLKNNEYIKYVTDNYWGTIVDFRTTLEPTDDAANVALEGKWHMPTQADVEELLRECTTEFGSYYGVNGYFVTGPNGNAIFLPAVGIKEGTDYEASTRGGDYWTSSLYEDNQAYAVTLSFALTYIDTDDMKRTNGLAIRPVIHRDYVGIDAVEADAIKVYAKDHTIYCEESFQIYTVTGLEVTHLNGALEGVYIVKTDKGNKLISVW